MGKPDNALTLSSAGHRNRQSDRTTAKSFTAGFQWMNRAEPVEPTEKIPCEGLLIGPADRYSLGQMLIPHVVSRMLNLSRLRVTGLVSSDHTEVGGHAVRNYGESALEMGGPGLKLIHTGGETLGCGLVESYREAIDDDEEYRFSSLLEIAEPDQIEEYVRRRTGQNTDFGYIIPPTGLFQGGSTIFHAAGLSEPGRLDDESRARLISLLRNAQFVGIRDRIGAEFLESWGIQVERMPCGLSVLPQVCARQLRENRDSDAMDEIRKRFPKGWIAVETGGVDSTEVASLASSLTRLSRKSGLKIVLFEGVQNRNAAPLRTWYESFAQGRAAVFASRNIWEVSSMILHSKMLCASTLGTRIVAMSSGIPRINLSTSSSEVASYCDLWEDSGVPVQIAGGGGCEAVLEEALTIDPGKLQAHANRLHDLYFASIRRMCLATGMTPRFLSGQRTTPHQNLAALNQQVVDEWFSEEKSERLFRRLNGNSGKRAVRRRLQQIFHRNDKANPVVEFVE